MPGRALDLESAAKECHTFTNAEQTPSDGPSLRPVVKCLRIEAHSVVRYGNAQCVVGVETEIHGHPTHLRMFHSVDEEFPDRFKQQRANVLPRRIGARIGRDLHVEAILLPGLVRQPSQGGAKSRALQHGRIQFKTEGSRGGNGLFELAPRLDNVFGRRDAHLCITFQLLIEVHRRNQQHLLETIVKRFGELFAGVVFRERQLGRHPAQLRRSKFQCRRPTLQRRGGLLAFRDVGDKRDRPTTISSGDVIQADFDRER